MTTNTTAAEGVRAVRAIIADTDALIVQLAAARDAERVRYAALVADVEAMRGAVVAIREAVKGELAKGSTT